MQQHVFTIARVCAEFGIRHAVICPGSRSAPLVFAFNQQPEITCYSVIDERSAGFMALGMAQQLQKPVVLICTSGTAGLNFFPAVAEAFYQKIPLLVLTADRPPELLNQQDGQMIMQKGVFGKHVRASHELMCFEEEKTDHRLSERIVHSALHETMSRFGFGPVHINVPLREPLYNIPSSPEIPPTLIKGPDPAERGAVSLPMMDTLIRAWKESNKKIIVVGQFPVCNKLTELLTRLHEQDDVVILADVCSNQHDSGAIRAFDSLLRLSDTDLKDKLAPDFVLSLGGPLVSKTLKEWFKGLRPNWHFRLQCAPEPIDTYGNMTHFLHSEEIPYLNAFTSMKGNNAANGKAFQLLWADMENVAKDKLIQFHASATWCEPSAVYEWLKMVPECSSIQLANSSPVRWVSWEGIPDKQLTVFGNRGTSGIDGSVSTALGAAIVNPDKQVTLLTGDLSFFYDEHAFWQNVLPANFKVIVLSNKGGRIFEWIDGPSKHPEYTGWFTTPHSRKVNELAVSYGINYFSCSGYEDFVSVIHQLYSTEGCSVLELIFEEEANREAKLVYKKL